MKSYLDRQPMTFDKFVSQQSNRRGIPQDVIADQAMQESEMEIETTSETDSESNSSVIIMLLIRMLSIAYFV